MAGVGKRNGRGAAIAAIRWVSWWDTWVKGSPQIVRTAAGKAIVVSIYDFTITLSWTRKRSLPNAVGKSGQQIVVLDPRGQVLRRTDISSPGLASATGRNFDPRPFGDGHDEIVCVDGGKSRAMRPGDEQWLWEWPSSGEIERCGIRMIPEILPAGKATRPRRDHDGTESGRSGHH